MFFSKIESFGMDFNHLLSNNGILLELRGAEIISRSKQIDVFKLDRQKKNTHTRKNTALHNIGVESIRRKLLPNRIAAQIYQLTSNMRNFTRKIVEFHAKAISKRNTTLSLSQLTRNG